MGNGRKNGGARYKVMACTVCGAEFMGSAQSSKYCPKCSYAKNNDMHQAMKRYQRARRITDELERDKALLPQSIGELRQLDEIIYREEVEEVHRKYDRQEEQETAANLFKLIRMMVEV